MSFRNGIEHPKIILMRIEVCLQKNINQKQNHNIQGHPHPLARSLVRDIQIMQECIKEGKNSILFLMR